MAVCALEKGSIVKITAGNLCFQVPGEKAQALADSFNIKYVECSAKTEDNVQEAFSSVSSALITYKSALRNTLVYDFAMKRSRWRTI